MSEFHIRSHAIPSVTLCGRACALVEHVDDACEYSMRQQLGDTPCESCTACVLGRMDMGRVLETTAHEPRTMRALAAKER